jgi:NADPH:quinone reductase-like Zn-dependent oxidoreductase
MPSKKKMKAAMIHFYGGIESIEIGETDVPLPKDDEVQIEVHYSGINPVDWKICDGLLQGRMESRFPIILGWDVCGKISSKGKNIHSFNEGDTIFAYCRKDVLHDGSFAEYLCLDAKNAVLKPKSLSLAQAASVPLSTLTSWQSLFETAGLKQGETVLIHAGAGGIGSFAIQLAKIANAYVITTATSPKHDYVRQLGADLVLDYSKEDFVDQLHRQFPDGVDVLYDTVGGSTLQASYKAVKKGGRLVSIAGIIDQALANQYDLQAEFVFVSPNGEQLQKIAEFFDRGLLKPSQISEIPFDQLLSALRKSREGHTQGKLILKIKET